ncbi:MAG: hypothetical protein JNM93_06615 [Bacteriovoracaceae bacterium]|nr:hypothetical protein [Bacteriovoracaceae bacterium]
MINFLILFASIFTFNTFSQERTLVVKSALFDKTQISFILIENTKPAVALKVNAEPLIAVKKQIETMFNQGKELKSPTDALIEVVSAEEMQLLTAKLSNSDIISLTNSISKEMINFGISCLGSASLVVNNVTESAYFFIHKRESLIFVRREIQRLYELKGGDKNSFDPEAYLPNLSLAFTNIDLNKVDGIVRDYSTCLKNIKVITEEISR